MLATAVTNREMLEAILKAEHWAVADYTQCAREAEAFGDKGLVVQLEDLVQDESGDSEETERMLRDWPLYVNEPKRLGSVNLAEMCLPRVVSTPVRRANSHMERGFIE